MSKIKSLISILRRKIFFYIIWPIAFAFASLRKKDPKLMVFAYSKNYTSMPDNMTGLYEYLKGQGYNCVIFASPQNAVRRMFADIKFQSLYARAKCVFVTDNFDPLYSHRPDKGTKVVQLWHACGAFKKWGYSTLDLPWGGSRKDMLRFPMHNTYTDVFVSAQSVIPCYAEAFGCNKNIIKALGTPRTDVFFDRNFIKKSRENILGIFPQIGKRKIILYAPTFRGNSPEQSYNDKPLDYASLRDKLGNEYALILKLHPFTEKKYKLSAQDKKLFGDFVFDGSAKIKIDEALCAADLLIADYSSLIFEYSLLSKPMLFYAYDLKKYEHDRSFYFDYKSFVPGKIVYSNEEIIKAIETNDFEEEKVQPFREKFMSACDGNCIEKIAKYVTEE